MPLYEYEHDAEHGEGCRKRFEVLQRTDNPPLRRCPECGRPCHRVISSFATIKSEKALLSPKNLERLGFTQYRRAGGGCYEKTCGGGPQLIRGDKQLKPG